MYRNNSAVPRKWIFAELQVCLFKSLLFLQLLRLFVESLDFHFVAFLHPHTLRLLFGSRPTLFSFRLNFLTPQLNSHQLWIVTMKKLDDFQFSCLTFFFSSPLSENYLFITSLTRHQENSKNEKTEKYFHGKLCVLGNADGFRNFASSSFCLRNENVFIFHFSLAFLCSLSSCRNNWTFFFLFRKKGCGAQTAQIPTRSLSISRKLIHYTLEAQRNNKKLYNFNVCWQIFFFSEMLCVRSRSFQLVFCFSSLRCLPKNWTTSRKNFVSSGKEKGEYPKKHDSTCFLMLRCQSRREGFLCSAFYAPRFLSPWSFIAKITLLHMPCADFSTLLLWMNAGWFEKRWGVAGRLTVCSKVNKTKHAESWMNVKPPALRKEKNERGNCARISIDRTEARERGLLPNLQLHAYTGLFKYWQRCTTWEKKRDFSVRKFILIINCMCCSGATKKEG
jgi:hypothetical protein